MINDLSRIEQRVYLKASPERVWRALADPAEFAAWWGCEVSEAFAPGKTVTLVSDGKPYDVDIVAMDAPSRLAWRWVPGAKDPAVDYSCEPRTDVQFDLVRFHQGTLLMVRETGFDPALLGRRPHVLTDNVNGWLGQSAALKRYLADHG